MFLLRSALVTPVPRGGSFWMSYASLRTGLRRPPSRTRRPLCKVGKQRGEGNRERSERRKRESSGEKGLGKNIMVNESERGT
jgi:hypothetical protein